MKILAARRRVLAVAACLSIVSSLAAQTERLNPTQQLEEFIHYTLIARPELAAGYAQKLLQSPITDAELAELVDDSERLSERLETALGKAHRVADLQELAAELERRIDEGRLDLARDPDRIQRAIQMLVGNLRMRIIAREQLAEAGEYAVPYLLRVITDPPSERLRLACGDMLVEIGRQAVTPLCEALLHLDERNQAYVCRLLGEIQLRHAAPFLRELADNPSAAAATREAARRAFNRVGGVEDDLATLYYELARQYFNEAESLIAFPFERNNNVWDYDAFHGLAATPVPTAIYSEVMAMRRSSKALDVDAEHRPALGLFVAANLRRENQLPGGAADPIYGENRYSPDFYATVFGTEVCMDVLGMGIDRLDTQLVRDAIAALSDTTGGANLFSAADGRQPLLEALQYPDRRVQYEAALTLGGALPIQRFAGDVRVVPLLASAVRSGDQSYAVVLGREGEDRRLGVSRLEDLGFTIVAAGPQLDAVRDQIAVAVGVDLVTVYTSDAEQAVATVAELHHLPKTAAAPVLVVAEALDMPRLRGAFRDDIRVKVARARITDDQFAEAVDEVMLRAAGGRMTEAQAEAYAIDAIMVLRDIAISRNTAYTVGDAEPALIQALETRSGELRLRVADILALLDSEQAQRKLFDAALAASGEEQVALLNRVAQSVKRFGDQAARRHVNALLQLIESSEGPVAEAAARVHGALTLPAGNAVELIP